MRLHFTLILELICIADLLRDSEQRRRGAGRCLFFRRVRAAVRTELESLAGRRGVHHQRLHELHVRVAAYGVGEGRPVHVALEAEGTQVEGVRAAGRRAVDPRAHILKGRAVGAPFFRRHDTQHSRALGSFVQVVNLSRTFKKTARRIM